MRDKLPLFVRYGVILFLVWGLSGCTLVMQRGQRKGTQQITQLQTEYIRLQDELSDLERAKMELEDRLKKEISDREVKVEMMERGLVITFVAEVLFDSGKAVLRPEALDRLSKVSRVLQTTVRDLDIGVEGHTDNVPIKYSGWKSNWELSSGRALSVLHYLTDDQGVDPTRLAATGYGEYRPVDSNDTKEGRQRNRRVEIVILPKTVKQPAQVETENLK